MNNQLRQLLYSQISEYLEPLCELVSCNTEVVGHGVQGGFEAAGQEYLENLFLQLGAASIEKSSPKDTTIKKAHDVYSEGDLGHNYENRANLYACFSGKKDRTLMFNGHIDTMPAGDTQLWKYDPYTPTIEDNRLYGLGACDMKGGLMAAVMAIKLLQEAGYTLPCNVIITSVVDEEGGGNGSIQAVFDGKKADGVVVCEPTANELVIAHMGFLILRVTVQGIATHAGTKKDGVSAIEKAFCAIKNLEKLEESWSQLYSHKILPFANINIGNIHTPNGNASTVPDACIFEICVHYLPSMDRECVIHEVQQSILESDPWFREHTPTIEVYQSGGAFSEEPSCPFVELWKETVPKITGRDLLVKGSPAGSDARLWSNLAHCPTVQLGPGNLEQCHAVDEYISVESYLEAILIYAQIILNF